MKDNSKIAMPTSSISDEVPNSSTGKMLEGMEVGPFRSLDEYLTSESK